jgi:putative ATP-binding cassette transporter
LEQPNRSPALLRIPGGEAMSLVRLVRRELQSSPRRLAFMIGLAGVSNAGRMAILYEAAQNAGTGKSALGPALLFVAAAAIFLVSEFYVMSKVTDEIQNLVHRLQLRLADYLRRCELIQVETIGRARIVSAMTTHMATLSQTTTSIVYSVQGAALILFAAVYIAYLSVTAFVVSLFVIGAASAVFLMMSRRAAKDWAASNRWQDRLLDRMTDLLDGFKEVRLNKPRNEALFEDIVSMSADAAIIRIQAQTDAAQRQVFAQTALFILLAAIVFAIPSYSSGMGDSVAKLVMALIFVVGACFGLLQTETTLAAANTAANAIEELEAQLRASASRPPAEPVKPAQRFDCIDLRRVGFHYTATPPEAGFRIGPVDFTLRSGELVFITGGNGSGKSTFMKVLAGLYKPDAGEIAVDGRHVTERNRDTYRSLFAAVFTDYHLFTHLYGIREPSRAEVERLLVEFGLARKTRLVDREFQSLALSDGQRKRLALIVSLLEHRPILLLDEWAADQDPQFRRLFYRDVLSALHRAGTTIVAVTHDVHYLAELDVPARRLNMDEGRFVEG